MDVQRRETNALGDYFLLLPSSISACPDSIKVLGKTGKESPEKLGFFCQTLEFLSQSFESFCQTFESESQSLGFFCQTLGFKS
jgi:hypothetical protein